MLRTLASIHDGLSRASFVIAAGVLAVMTGAYCYEVVARYFFNAPTIWASPLVSYGLCATIFLALPDLTRRGAHVDIDLHEQYLSAKAGAVLKRAVAVISAAACFMAGYITAMQTWSEYIFGVWTNTYWPIPKWSLFVLIPYGLFSAAVYFLRHAFAEASPAEVAQ